MVNQQLIAYIKSTLAQGYSTTQIYNNLVQYGHNPNEVSMAINMATSPSSTIQRPSNISIQQSTVAASEKSTNFLPISVIGIFLLVIVGGGLFFFNPFKSSRPVGTPGEMLSPGGEVSQEPVAVSSGKENCGSVDNTHLFMAPQDRTHEEDRTVSCFNERLVSCNPTTFEITGQGGASYEIIKQEGDKCLISSLGKTCKVPISFIKDSQDAAKQQGTPEMTFLAAVMIFSMGNPTDMRTGETINIECS